MSNPRLSRSTPSAQRRNTVRAVHLPDLSGRFPVGHTQRGDEQRILAGATQDRHGKFATGKAPFCDADDRDALAEVFEEVSAKTRTPLSLAVDEVQPRGQPAHPRVLTASTRCPELMPHGSAQPQDESGSHREARVVSQAI